MATGKMLLLNLKAYPRYGQLPSNSRHDRSPVPSTVMIMNRPHYCTTYKRKLLTCSSSMSNVSRFVIANTMAASSEMLLISTAEQPIYKGGSCVSSTILFHADQTTLDAGSSHLFVVKNILNHAAHMADNALLVYAVHVFLSLYIKFFVFSFVQITSSFVYKLLPLHEL